MLSTYINHLVRARRSTDLEIFDALLRSARAEAREGLEKFRDNHQFDPEKILATELYIALDKNFSPIEQPGDGGKYRSTRELLTWCEVLSTLAAVP